jgi:class 3 adenylate cyclase
MSQPEQQSSRFSDDHSDDGELMREMEVKLFYLAASGDLIGSYRMVENGVSVNVLDYNNRSPLHLACERGHLQVVEFLIESKAEINCQDNFGETPSSLAAARNHTSIELFLQQAGANCLASSNLELRTRRSRRASFAVMEAFPRPIAVAMLEGRCIEPISKSMVSLLFSDIVGFTTISSTMDPAKVSSLLNRLFRKFDDLSYLHGVQKIDVVGDAYIAATNFMEDQAADHAARLARFAIDAMKAARETCIDEEHPDLFGCIPIRIGMHCGPVAGSVIGSQNLKYTLIGDTVNIASRMESTSTAGRIQCSQRVAALLAEQADEIVLQRRWAGQPAISPMLRSEEPGPGEKHGMGGGREMEERREREEGR